MRELKLAPLAENKNSRRSHPLRVRELKRENAMYDFTKLKSHPLRVRELKQCTEEEIAAVFGRTLYGCVN